MKRIIPLLLAVIVLLGAAGCAKTSVPQATLEGTTTEIIEKIYANHTPVDLYLETRELDVADSDAVAHNLGLTSGEGITQCSLSEPMMGSQAYSLAVVRVKEGNDTAKIAKEIYDNVNMRKWICVEADVKTVAYYGDVVMLYLVNSEFTDVPTSQSIQDAFRTACGGQITIVG